MPENEEYGPEPGTQSTANFSASFGKLAEALAKATLGFKPVLKGNKNPFFKSKYADLATLLEATREPLAKQGLSVVQFPGEATNGRVSIITMLIHGSGEWLRSEIVMPCAKPDAQGVGSALTYGRRYAYGAMLSLGAEDDDDGNAAVGSRNAEITEELDNKLKNQERINGFQVTAIKEACVKSGKTDTQQSDYLDSFGLKQWEQLQKQDFQAALKWANGLKAPAKASGGSTGAPAIEQKDLARLFAVAAERGVPREDVQRYGHETFAVESLKDLNKKQADELLQWIQQA